MKQKYIWEILNYDYYILFGRGILTSMFYFPEITDNIYTQTVFTKEFWRRLCIGEQCWWQRKENINAWWCTVSTKIVFYSFFYLATEISCFRFASLGLDYIKLFLFNSVSIILMIYCTSKDNWNLLPHLWCNG